MRVLAVLALALGASARHQPLKMPIKSRALSVRGGFVDASTAAKVGTTLVSANAAVMSLAPSKASEIYGIEFDAMTEWIAENIGYLFVCQAVMAWLALNGASTNTAIGCGLIPNLVVGVKTLLNDTPKKLGVPAPGMIFNTALNAFAVYALLTGQEYADNVAKFMVGFFALNGVVFAVAPATGAGAWGVKGDDKVEFMMKAFGYFISSWALTAGALVKGEDAAKAVGLGYIPALLNIIDANFISKSVAKFGMEITPQYFWAAIQIAVIFFTCV
jgi:hypothetical protein